MNESEVHDSPIETCVFHNKPIKVISKPGPFAGFGSSGFDSRPAQPKNRIQILAFSELDPYYDLAGAGTETADAGPLL